jgi:hypothetical protein
MKMTNRLEQFLENNPVEKNQYEANIISALFFSGIIGITAGASYASLIVGTANKDLPTRATYNQENNIISVYRYDKPLCDIAPTDTVEGQVHFTVEEAKRLQQLKAMEEYKAQKIHEYDSIIKELQK